MIRPVSLAFLCGLVSIMAVAGWVLYWKQSAPADVHADSSADHARVPAPVQPQPSLVASPGRIEPVSEEIFVGAEIAGTVRQIMVREGDHVRKGQVLAVLNGDDLAANLESCNAQVGVKEAELRRIVNGARSEERLEAAAMVREAQFAVDQRQVELDRRRQLFSSGDIAKSQVGMAQRDYQMAQEHLAAAREHLGFLEAPAREDEKERAEGAVAMARAAAREAEARLMKTQVRSPIDGTILRRNLKPGESVSDPYAQPLFTLGDVSRLRVRAEVDEGSVGMVRVGQRAYVTADAYPGHKFRGRVVVVGQLVGTRKVRTDAPGERLDRKVVETLIDLESASTLPPGLRVDAFIEVNGRY